MPPLPPIILSGGQTGVDQSALRAAQDSGLEISGWCPPNRLSDSGPIPSRYPLHPTPHDRSPTAPDLPRSQRTEWNVRDADATLILLPPSTPPDPGTAFTLHCATRLHKPTLTCDPSDSHAATRISHWLSTHPIQSLNVAGPSESTSPGISHPTYTLLLQVFQCLNKYRKFS